MTGTLRNYMLAVLAGLLAMPIVYVMTEVDFASRAGKIFRKVRTKDTWVK